jgi:hypothetical protein
MNNTALKDLFLLNGITGTKTMNFLSTILMDDNSTNNDIEQTQKAMSKVLKAKFKVDVANAVYPLFTKKIVTVEQFKKYFNLSN